MEEDVLVVSNEETRRREKAISLQTANGPIKTNEVVDIYIPLLNETLTFYILEGLHRGLISMATLTAKGYTFIWDSDGAYLYGKKTSLDLELPIPLLLEHDCPVLQAPIK